MRNEYVIHEIDWQYTGGTKKTKALERLHQSKSKKKIMVDIESADERAENAEQRKKRKKFYLRAGYEETSVKYEWRNENYEILSFGGQISEAEYNGFWEDLRKQSEEHSI